MSKYNQGYKRSAEMIILALALLVVEITPPIEAGDTNDPRATWDPSYHTLSFSFQGKECRYPRDIVTEKFPPVGAPPEFQFEKKWPVVTMRARWTAPIEGWPPKYRPNAVDLILLFACNAQLYEHFFPEIVRSSTITYPLEYVREAKEPLGYSLAETMRGKEVGYEVTVKAGFGAPDYTIKTKIHIGLSEDGKTIFYYDRPEYISDYLERKDYFFAAHDAGDCIRFEARMVAVCAPRRLMRGEMMRRVEAGARYFVQRLYEALSDEPTAGEIENLINTIIQERKALTGGSENEGGGRGREPLSLQEPRYRRPDVLGLQCKESFITCERLLADPHRQRCSWNDSYEDKLAGIPANHALRIPSSF